MPKYLNNYDDMNILITCFSDRAVLRITFILDSSSKMTDKKFYGLSSLSFLHPIEK